jgi:queuine tRNA-ribosyltransferase
LWTPAAFAGIFGYAHSKSVDLYTYSAATAVRVALLTAGFFVGEGVGTGPKADTTVAFSRESGAANHPLKPRLLGAEWLARWRRSGSKWPGDLAVEDRAVFERKMEMHPQFSAVVARG